MDINGAVVLVTGASSGIGAATARAASRAGAQVVLVARREDRIRQLAGELGEAVPVRCDVTDAGQVDAAVRAATDAFGRIDVLCNIAGQGLHAPLEQIDPDDFRAVLELNLVAPLVTMQAVLPIMRKQGSGSIVNVSSGITFSALPGSAAYGASKAGLSKLSAVGACRARRRRHCGLDDVPVHHGYRVHRITSRRNRIRVGARIQPCAEAPVARASRRGDPRPDQDRRRAGRPRSRTVRRQLQGMRAANPDRGPAAPHGTTNWQ